MQEFIDQGEHDVERFIDRYWFLVNGRGRLAGDAPARGAGDSGTLVIRDGDCVVVSVDAAALGWPEGTLLFRLRSATTPCVGCVDRAMALARHRAEGRLGPADVQGMLRFAVARCAAWGADPAHAPAAAPERAAPAPGAARRSGADLWLVV